MSLMPTNIPPPIIRAFTSGLGNYVDPSRRLYSLLLQKYVALESFSLSLTVLPGTNSPADFRDNFSNDGTPHRAVLIDDYMIQTGWLFAAAETDLYGGCHVGSNAGSANPVLTGFSEDVQILTHLESLAQVTSLSQVQAKGVQYELRILNVRWLHFQAFWLYTVAVGSKGIASSGKRSLELQQSDLFVPYAGFVEGPPNCLQASPPYTLEGFLKAIGPNVVNTSDDVTQQVARRITCPPGNGAPPPRPPRHPSAGRMTVSYPHQPSPDSTVRRTASTPTPKVSPPTRTMELRPEADVPPRARVSSAAGGPSARTRKRPASPRPKKKV